MKSCVQISVDNWHLFLAKLADEINVYIPAGNGLHWDYRLFTKDLKDMVYNHPAPVTPLKNFFIPVKENVVIGKNKNNKRLIVGATSCDLKALELLDEIYLDAQYPDQAYKDNRDNTILIGSGCHETRENCHCTSYGVEPYPGSNADATLAVFDGTALIQIVTAKGETLFEKMQDSFPVSDPDPELLKLIGQKKDETKQRLSQKNRDLPGYEKTGLLIRNSADEIWIRHAGTCVSCGACAVICPTCTCFLLIDRPGFEKVRQVDACQYPGFEKIAAGEDPLRQKHVRFRNRYMCKYVWKPETFNSLACTGCGRCIDGCIGNISKNKIFLEMVASF